MQSKDDRVDKNRSHKDNDVVVSIVIVCMNNLKNLFLCLESIKRYITNVTYETYVVAYLFSEENLRKARTAFPWAFFIESNEIRGFSENNNLALRQIKGKYCFVLNDDTELVSPLLEKLVHSIESLPEDTAIVSPATYYPDGSVQCCGRPPISLWHFVLSEFGLWNDQRIKSQYTHQRGLFKSYNILGAAFLIKTDIFKKVGWFDERFFFTPEDVALSTKLNKMGYSCYVNADIHLIHYEGQSRNTSMTYAAIKPASTRGNLIFFSEGKPLLYMLLVMVNIVKIITAYVYHLLLSLGKEPPNRHYALMKGYQYCMESCFTRKTPKELFIKYYNRIKKQKS